MKKYLLQIVDIVNKIRIKSAIPLFVIWSLTTSFCIGKIDSFSANNAFVGIFIHSIWYMLPLLLIFIKKPIWVRTLFGIGFCFFYGSSIVVFMPKVPYDASVSLWMGSMLLFMHILPIMGMFVTYAICEVAVKILFIKLKRMSERGRA